MRKRLYKFAASALAMSAVPAGAIWAEGIHGEAMRLAADKNFDGALSLLAAEDAADQNTIEHRLLKARLLSWAGRYDQALSVLEDLRQSNHRILMSMSSSDILPIIREI